MFKMTDPNISENLNHVIEMFTNVFNDNFLLEQQLYTENMNFVLGNGYNILKTSYDTITKELSTRSLDTDRASEICNIIMKSLYNSFWNFLNKTFYESINDTVFAKITEQSSHFINETTPILSERTRLIENFPSEYTFDNRHTFNGIFNDLKTLSTNANKIWNDIETNIILKEEENSLLHDINVKVYDNEDNLLYENKYNPETLVSKMREDINIALPEDKQNKDFLLFKASSYRKDTKESIMCTTPPPPRLRYLSTSRSTATLKESILKIRKTFGDNDLDTYFGLTPLDHIRIII